MGLPPAAAVCALLLTAAWSSVSAVAPAPGPGADLDNPLPVVPMLNADYFDGLDSADFAPLGHDHDDRYYTEEESDGRYLPAAGKAVDADLLDGQDSAAFAAAGHDHDDRYLTEAESDGRYLAAGAKAADADLLDGLDSAAFAGAGHDHDGRYYTQADVDAMRPVAATATNTGYVPAGGQGAQFQYIPGLSVNLTLARESLVQLSAYGAQRHVSGVCHVGYRVVVDGVARGNADWGLAIQMSSSGDLHHLWSMLHAETLPAGDHDLVVQAKPFATTGAGCNICAEVGGAIHVYERCLVNVLAVPV